MKRVLFTWEYGERLGHAIRDLALAKDFMCLNIDVHYCYQGVQGADLYPGVNSNRLHQGAGTYGAIEAGSVSIGAAQLWWRLDGHSKELMLNKVKRWISIYKAVRPDWIVYNYSPVAMLAAYICNIPTLLVGTPFELPLLETDLGMWYEHLKYDKEYFSMYLDTVNYVLSMYSKSTINNLSQLSLEGLGYGYWITASPGLDMFAGKRIIGTNYIGAPNRTYGRIIDWVDLSEHTYRILLYLRSSDYGILRLLSLIQSDRWKIDGNKELILISPNIINEHKLFFNKFNIHDCIVDLNYLWENMDIFIASGGTTIYRAIDNSVPVLSVPIFLEQRLVGEALEQHKIGWCLSTTTLSKELLDTLNLIVEQLEDKKEYVKKYNRMYSGYLHIGRSEFLKTLVKIGE